MAKLKPTRPEFVTRCQEIFAGYRDNTWRAKEAAFFKELEAIGPIIDFPVGDGKAVYLVVSESPPVIEHIPLGDAWQIPAAHIRGLNAAALREEVRRKKAMAALFARDVITNALETVTPRKRTR